MDSAAADTHVNNGDGTDAPGDDHEVAPPTEDVNGYTNADAPAPAAAQNGEARIETHESPAPAEVTMEPEVAAKTDAPKRKGWWNRFGG
jgi:hypothetical protein